MLLIICVILFEEEVTLEYLVQTFIPVVVGWIKMRHPVRFFVTCSCIDFTALFVSFEVELTSPIESNIVSF